MRDHLLDIVQHTHGIGVLNLVKITGTSESTTINAYDSETKTVILSAEFKKPVAELVGVFGMPNLDRLNTILNIPVYKDDAVITPTTKTEEDGSVVLDGISFVSKDNDFKNTYRFMLTSAINAQLKSVGLRQGINWNVSIVPSAASIQKLKFQAAAHSDASTFYTQVENGALKCYFGDESSHGGNFVFASNVTGTLAKKQFWPLAIVNTILSLTGDKTLKISDSGLLEITVDSGLAVYHYMLPAQSK